MDNAELSKKLREISRSTKGSTYSRTMCRIAAQRIDKLAAELEETRALLAGAIVNLKNMDQDCELCDHAALEKPCWDDESWPMCADCQRDCPCKDCTDNSNWTCKVLEEAAECACNGAKPLLRPPQSWCYVEGKDAIT